MLLLYIANNSEVNQLSKRSEADNIGAGIASFVFVALFFCLIVFLSYRMKAGSVAVKDDEEGLQQMRRSLGLTRNATSNQSQQNVSAVSLAPIYSIYDFVPPYNMVADEKVDLGYYDADGNFHAVDNIALPNPPEKVCIR